MNEREKKILRMAMIYLSANLDDAVAAFETEHSVENQLPMRQLSVNGEQMDEPTEQEMESVMKTLQ